MKSRLAGLIYFVCVIISPLIVEAADTGQPFRPQWDNDLVWHVQVVYASPVSQSTWSEPVLWEYRLSRTENSSSQGSFIYIDARCIDAMASSARFTYRTDDFTLVSAEISNIVRGQEKIKTLTFDGGVPVLTRQSPIVFDAPVFPAFPGSKHCFKVVSRIDDFLKKQSILEQSVFAVEGGGAPLPEWTAGKKILKIECRDKEDGKRLFIQYWDAELPWPVYGENDNMKYWIEVK